MLVHIAGNAGSKLLKIDPADIQPNAIDVRIDKVWELQGDFWLSEDEKIQRTKTQIEPLNNDYYSFQPGRSYEISLDNIVTVALDEAGFIIPRSTLNRNGIFITSGLYDSGYEGGMLAALHVADMVGGTYIKKGTRVGQYLAIKSEGIKAYDGSWGYDENGNPKELEKVYHQ